MNGPAPLPRGVGPAALRRLPERLLNAVEALWPLCVEAARQRAAIQLQTKTAHVAETEQNLEVRSNLFPLRERDLD